MRKSRFSQEQIINFLREAEGGQNVDAVCARHNLSKATFYGWKKKYGCLDVSEARRLRSLEDENSRLKRLVADQAVQIQILKEGECKKVVSPSQKRRAIQLMVEENLGTTAQACRALGLARSSFYLASQRSPESQAM